MVYSTPGMKLDIMHNNPTTPLHITHLLPCIVPPPALACCTTTFPPSSHYTATECTTQYGCCWSYKVLLVYLLHSTEPFPGAQGWRFPGDPLISQRAVKNSKIFQGVNPWIFNYPPYKHRKNMPSKIKVAHVK